MEDKSIYLTHAELCELLDVPEDTGLLADEDSLIFWPPAEMWRLTVKVGTKEEVQEMCNGR